MVSTPSPQQVALREILLNLVTKSQTCWDTGYTLEGNKLKKHAIDGYEELQSYRPQVRVDEIFAMTRTRRDQMEIGHKSAIYLPPLDDDSTFIPLLSMEMDRKKHEFKFRVDMYEYDGSSGGFNYMAFRFEAPTKHNSKHPYFHVQPSEREASTIENSKGLKIRIPGSVPTIPTVAWNSVSLVLSLVLGFYGVKGYSDIISEARLKAEFTDQLAVVFDNGQEWIELGE